MRRLSTRVLLAGAVAFPVAYLSPHVVSIPASVTGGGGGAGVLFAPWVCLGLLAAAFAWAVWTESRRFAWRGAARNTLAHRWPSVVRWAALGRGVWLASAVLAWAVVWYAPPGALLGGGAIPTQLEPLTLWGALLIGWVLSSRVDSRLAAIEARVAGRCLGCFHELGPGASVCPECGQRRRQGFPAGTRGSP